MTSWRDDVVFPIPKQGPKPKARRKRINPVSDKRRAENIERRQAVIAAFGQFPDCALCAPLAAHGIRTGCNGKADDADELLRRSAGGSITDVANIRPAGRRCHDWIGANHGLAIEWGLVQSRVERGNRNGRTEG